jgi:hypothetical protein
MSPIVVLAGVGVMAVSAAVTLAVLIIGIRRADRRRLTNASRSHSEELARRLLLGVRDEKRWPEQ